MTPLQLGATTLVSAVAASVCFAAVHYDIYQEPGEVRLVLLMGLGMGVFALLAGVTLALRPFGICLA